MIKVWVRDHTLCIDFPNKCFLLRPCSSLDGRFKFNGHDVPWFKTKELISKSGKTIWSFFAVPYICLGVVRHAS